VLVVLWNTSLKRTGGIARIEWDRVSCVGGLGCDGVLFCQSVDDKLHQFRDGASFVARDVAFVVGG
jgi:hypothetical protein